MIDYVADDFTRSGSRWDVILDTVGNASLARCRSSLTANGRLLLIAGGLSDLLKAPIQSRISGIRVAGGPAPERQKDLEDLKNLCEAGAYRPVVGRTFPLEQIAQAHAEVDSNRKVGNVVVTMGHSR
jgi:NADPH:quinone reductase-like Zn-dependent oxidoreductase